MRKHRKKYEPAGGVVPLDWKQGWPDADEVRYGNGVWAEVWDANIGFSQKTVCLSASIVPVTLDHNDRLLFGGNELGRRECRRWVSLKSVIHHTPLTLKAWPEPSDA